MCILRNLEVTVMAAVVSNLFLLLLWFTISYKEILQQWPGALITEADPLHVRGHVLVQDCEVLRVEELVHLYLPPHPILLLTTPSSSTLNHS